MDLQQNVELQDLLALQDLQRHIAEPCSRDLLGDYLDTLRGLIEGTEYNWIRKMAEESLHYGQAFYESLVDTDQEPRTSVIR